MFKLISLSSPSGLFQEIIFRDGLNIILGKYSTSKKDINGIGKTTIVNLIDFCLLADGPKNLLFSDKYNFLKQETVCLKFLTNEQVYVIERNFQKKDEAILINGKGHRERYNDVDLRLILGAEIGKKSHYEGIYDSLWFRTLMNFFVQNDHAFLARDSKNVLKFTVGKRQTELLTYCLMIMGIDNSLIWSFDTNKVDLKKLQSDQSRITSQIVEQTGKSIHDFKAECDAVNRKVEKLQEGVDNYKFDYNQTDIESKISDLSLQISDLNKEHLFFSKKYSDIKESLKINVDIDVETIANLYNDLNNEFSVFIKKSLNDVISFRQEISANRSKFLKERELQYEEKLRLIRDKLIKLDQERSVLYKMLDEKAAFDVIKSSYLNLIDEKSKLANKQSYLSQLDYVENKIADKKSEAGSIVSAIVKSKQVAARRIDGIKEIFLDIVENSVDTEQVDVNPYFNIEYKSNQTSPIQAKLEVPRGSSLGKGRFKILAFDLTIFIASASSGLNLPSFLIHDGVMHGIAHKTRINFLNYINKKLDGVGNMQYIITINEDEVIFPKDGEVSVSLDFDLKEKSIATLEDNPKKMFLGKEFG